MNRGQINLWVALAGAIGMIGASAIGGWFSASNRVGQAETKIEVIVEREANHFSELTKSIEKIDKKLDLLLDQKTKK